MDRLAAMRPSLDAVAALGDPMVNVAALRPQLAAVADLRAPLDELGTLRQPLERVADLREPMTRLAALAAVLDRPILGIALVLLGLGLWGVVTFFAVRLAILSAGGAVPRRKRTGGCAQRRRQGACPSGGTRRLARRTSAAGPHGTGIADPSRLPEGQLSNIGHVRRTRVEGCANFRRCGARPEPARPGDRR